MKKTSWILVAASFFSWAHSAFAQDPLNRALLLYERRDFEGALQETNRVIQNIPTYSRAYTLRGQIKYVAREIYRREISVENWTRIIVLLLISGSFIAWSVGLSR